MISRDVREQWVIYERPLDFPAGYVVRKWTIGRRGLRPASTGYKTLSIEDARRYIASVRTDLYCLPSSRGDDPHIVETWL